MNEIWIHKAIVNGFYNTDKRYIVTYGGRGSAKSTCLGAIAVIFALQNPNSRILAIRGTQNRISESSLQILKDVIEMLGLDDFFIQTEHSLSCKNGSSFMFYGAKSYQSFKSLQGIDLVFVDEATELSKEAWEVLIPTIRNENSRFLISFNPDTEEDWVYDQFIKNEHPEAYVIKINYDGNPYFPKVLKTEMLYDKERDYAKYLHVWLGELRQETEGALWNRDMLRNIVISSLPNDYDEIVVSIDPSVTNTSSSDACGLIVIAKSGDEYFVLEDETSIMSPKEWVEKAVKLYTKYDADYIVYEANQGGDLVKTLIYTYNKSIPVRSVFAKRSKKVRAEEILYLYEEGKVFHSKHFKNLELEMVTFTGSKKDKSPNSLDALVWGLKSIAPDLVNKVSGTKKVKKESMRF